MPIVTALALPYQAMQDIIMKLENQEPIPLSIEQPSKPLERVVVMSLLDPKTGYDHECVSDETTETALPRLFADKPNERLVLVCHDQEHGNKAIQKLHTPEIAWFTKAHAEKVVTFLLEAHKDPRNTLFLVNCHYGQCRSGAVAEFASTIFDLGAWNTKKNNPNSVPNHLVMFRLWEEYFKRTRAE